MAQQEHDRLTTAAEHMANVRRVDCDEFLIYPTIIALEVGLVDA